MSLFIPGNTSYLKSVLSNINIAILTFLWLVTIWYIAWHSITSNISELLHFKIIVDSCYLYVAYSFKPDWQSLIFNWFRPYVFNVIIDMVGLHLPSCYLFSICPICLLFFLFFSCIPFLFFNIPFISLATQLWSLYSLQRTSQTQFFLQVLPLLFLLFIKFFPIYPYSSLPHFPSPPLWPWEAFIHHPYSLSLWPCLIFHYSIFHYMTVYLHLLAGFVSAQRRM